MLSSVSCICLISTSIKDSSGAAESRSPQLQPPPPFPSSDQHEPMVVSTQTVHPGIWRDRSSRRSPTGRPIFASIDACAHDWKKMRRQYPTPLILASPPEARNTPSLPALFCPRRPTSQLRASATPIGPPHYRSNLYVTAKVHHMPIRNLLYHLPGRTGQR